MKNLPILFLSTLLFASFQLFAQGDLLITPKRIVFENNNQKEEINLVNIGNDTATYSISFVQYKMNEDGSFTLVENTDSSFMFADPYLRIFPRKVTLAPKEPQVISLQCRRSANMVAGEYRSHLYFRSEKNNSPLGSQNSLNDTSKFKVQLVPVFGLSIPVIIRSGQVEAIADLSDLKIENSADLTQNLQLTINRKGNSSVFGDIVIQYFPLEGKPVDIGRLNNVAVYTTINKRYISVKLRNTGNSNLTAGKLKVQYVSKNEKSTLIQAEKELNIN